MQRGLPLISANAGMLHSLQIIGKNGIFTVFGFIFLFNLIPQNRLLRVVCSIMCSWYQFVRRQ